MVVEGEEQVALLDGGSQVSLISAAYAQKRGLEVGTMETLMDMKLKLDGLGGHWERPLGFVTARLQVPGIKGFDEDTIFLIVDDESSFTKRVPVVLGTNCLRRVLMTIKESEIDELSTSWQSVNLTEGLAARMRKAIAEEKVREDIATKPLDPRSLEEILVLTEDQELEPFSTTIVKGRMKMCLTGCRMNVMTSGLPEKECKLPHGLQVQPVYTNLKDGSKVVETVIRNTTATKVKLKKRMPFAKVWAANEMPKPTPSPGLMAAAEAMAGVEKTLTVEERRELLKQKLDLSGLDSWPAHLREKAIDLLMEYHDVFALDPNELGCSSKIKHEIKLVDDEPFKERFRRIPQPMVEEVRTVLKDMLDSGAISPSQSPWCNAVVLVRKKDGSLRFCIDFRRLNQMTKKDSYPLPRINEAIDSLQGAGYFSSLDLKSGFWQVLMDEDSKQYTAFTVGNLGFYECERMPFGLCNAPATFQRLMENTLGELNLTYCLIYLDDVIVFSKTMEDHLHRLRVVLQRFRDENLKLKPGKCNFFQEQIDYLAHTVTKDGVRPSDAHLEAIRAFPLPTNFTEIRAFLGLTGHFRRFVEHYAHVAEPLNEHLRGEGSKKKKQSLKLTPQAIEAFYELKKRVLNAPVLAFADFTKPFLLETDASGQGLGAVLSQKQKDGRYHPVAFGSRTLKRSERNYHSSKLEFLALKWAVTSHFKEYLIFQPFEVRTDNNPLTYIQTTPNLDATGHRWVGELASFDFTLTYLKGKNNGAADALSRVPYRKPGDTSEDSGSDSDSDEIVHLVSRAAWAEEDTISLGSEVIDCLMDGAMLGCSRRCEVTIPALEQEVERINEEVNAHAARAQMHITDWAKEQDNDPLMRATKRWLWDDKRQNWSSYVSNELKGTPEYNAYSRVKSRFVMSGKTLYLRLPGDTDELPVFVVPRPHRMDAINGCHRDACHQGRDRTIAIATERFWWPGVRTSMINACANCERCHAFEGSDGKAPLKSIYATSANQLVHIDFTSMESEKELMKDPNVKNVLVITDHFTRYAQAFVTKDQKAETVARILYDRYISVFGAPEALLSDQGANFTSKVIAALCDLFAIRKLQTSPYHAQCNGQVERFHQTLSKMLGKVWKDRKEDWPQFLPQVVHAYNSTRSAVTGYSPFYLMFGRRPRLPVDLYFPTRRTDHVKSTLKHVADLRDRLVAAYEAARAVSQAEANRQKIIYDRRTSAPVLKPGDTVLISADGFRGKRKLKARWDDQVYEVIGQVAPDVPAYRLRAEGGSTKVVHRNRLLLVAPANELGVPLRVAECVCLVMGARATASEPSEVTELGEGRLSNDSPQDRVRALLRGSTPLPGHKGKPLSGWRAEQTDGPRLITAGERDIPP